MQRFPHSPVLSAWFSFVKVLAHSDTMRAAKIFVCPLKHLSPVPLVCRKQVCILASRLPENDNQNPQSVRFITKDYLDRARTSLKTEIKKATLLCLQLLHPFDTKSSLVA